MEEYLEAFQNRVKRALWYIRGRRLDYRLTFQESNPSSRRVLEDLCVIGHIHQTTTTEREAGRREVVLHILQQLNLTDEELWALYTKDNPEVEATGYDRAKLQLG